MNDRIDPIEFARQRRQVADEFDRLMWQNNTMWRAIVG